LAGGAPIGNKNATKNRPITEALRRVLLAEDGKKLRELTEAIVKRSIESSDAAAREILERIEGKVPQQVDHGNADGEPFVVKVEPSDANL